MSTQIVVLLENRLGALAEVTDVLAAAGVNIEAILLEGTVDFGAVRLHVDAPRKAQKALREAGFQFRTGEALRVPLPNAPGQIAELARKLAGAKVNIDAIFGTTAGNGTPEVVLMVDDAEKARKALGLSG